MSEQTPGLSEASEMGVAPFGARLQRAVQENGPLVGGIDPHQALLEQWGLPDDPTGLERFSQIALEAYAGRVAAIKPQSAFYERHGSRGLAVLEDLLAAARDRGVLSILDVKRGDIGSTLEAYAAAHLLPGAPGEADAITLSPFLGFGSLRPALDAAMAHGKGLFVLALTSNPDGPQVQHAVTTRDTPVAREIAEQAEAAGGGSAETWGSVGLVVGATVGSAVRDLRLLERAGSVPLLAPGFGAQGAGPAQMSEVFGEAAPRVLVAISRGLLAAGPDPQALAEHVQRVREEYSSGAPTPTR